MYRLLMEELINEEGRTYITYGIVCDTSNKVISDITTDRHKIEEFIKLINESELAPVHLMDVVEDYLDELQ